MRKTETIKVNNVEYLKIREIKYDNSIYDIYFDTKSYSKVLIYNDRQELIQDQKLLNNILEYVFLKKKDIVFEEGFIYKPTEDKTEFEYIYTEEEKNDIIEKAKSMFFQKFGTDLLSEEELDRRIKQNIRTIKLRYPLIENVGDIVGYYNRQKKEIGLSAKEKDVFKDENFFHEFMHGILYPEIAKRIITESQLDANEDYEYGTNIEEGIVSYIENMINIDEFQSFKKTGSYDRERRLIAHIRALYRNTENGNGKDFIKETVKDPRRYFR